MNAQQKALEKIFAAVEKKHKTGSITLMGKSNAGQVRGVIPSGIEALDRYIIGPGGWPFEKVSEVFGPEGAGKTSLVLACLGAVQRAGGIGFHVDAENAMSEERCMVLGVDKDQLLLANDFEHAEEAGERLFTALDACTPGVPFMGVFDSVPAMVTKMEAEAELEDVQMAPMSRFMSKFMPRLIKKLKGKDAHIIFVNQTREKIGVMFGNPETTPGGKSLKFFSSTRIRVSKMATRDGGMEVKVKSVKSRFSEPQRELVAFLNFHKGWDNKWTTLNHAKDMKVTGNTAKDVDDARVALGWPMAEAAMRLGADPATAQKAIGKKRAAPGKV